MVKEVISNKVMRFARFEPLVGLRNIAYSDASFANGVGYLAGVLPRARSGLFNLYIDNTAAEGCLLSQSSRRSPMAYCAFEFWTYASQHGVSPWLSRVASELNLADVFTREEKFLYLLSQYGKMFTRQPLLPVAESYLKALLMLKPTALATGRCRVVGSLEIGQSTELEDLRALAATLESHRGKFLLLFGGSQANVIINLSRELGFPYVLSVQGDFLELCKHLLKKSGMRINEEGSLLVAPEKFMGALLPTSGEQDVVGTMGAAGVARASAQAQQAKEKLSKWFSSAATNLDSALLKMDARVQTAATQLEQSATIAFEKGKQKVDEVYKKKFQQGLLQEYEGEQTCASCLSNCEDQDTQCEDNCFPEQGHAAPCKAEWDACLTADKCASCDRSVPKLFDVCARNLAK
eukprot:g12803.t1